MEEPRNWNWPVYREDGTTETRADHIRREGWDAFNGEDPYTLWLIQQRRDAVRELVESSPKSKRKGAGQKASPATEEHQTEEAPGEDPVPDEGEGGL